MERPGCPTLRTPDRRRPRRSSSSCSGSRRPRFSAAEYDDPIDGRAPSFRRRVAWYAIGLVLVAGDLPRPSRRRSTTSRSAAGDRPKAFLVRLPVRGASGRRSRSASRSTATAGCASPTSGRIPGALLNAVVTALIDEVAFRGAILGLLLLTGLEPTAANAIQALLYALATRLGAPGRNRWHARHGAPHRARRRLGDRASPAASRRRSSATPSRASRSSSSTGHAGQFLPRGREVEEIEAKRRPPKGWRVIGPREPSRRATGDDRPRPAAAIAQPCRAEPARRSRRRPSGSTSTSRSASRSARTATSSSSPARPRAGRRTGSPRSWPRCRRELELRADALDARVRAAGLARARPPLDDGLSRRRHAVAPAARRPSPRCSRLVRRRFGLAADAEITIEANPGPDERGDAGGPRRGRGHPDLVRRPEPRSRPSSAGSAGAIGPADVGDAVAAARAGGIGSINLDLLYDIPDGSLATWIDTLETRARARAGPPLALRPDPRRSRCRGPDRPRRRPPADDAAAPAAGATRRSRPRTRIARPPSTTTPSIASPATAGAATRSATGRGRATRAATTSPTGSAGRTRRSGPGAHAFDGATRRWNAAHLGALRRGADAAPADAPRRRLPPGGAETLDAGDGRGRGRRPRAPDGPRPAPRGRDRAAARRRLRLGARGRAADDRRGRPDRPHDPRPAPLERAVRPPHLTRWSRSGIAGPPRLALTLGRPDC